jgi:hypothetical protein
METGTQVIVNTNGIHGEPATIIKAMKGKVLIQMDKSKVTLIVPLNKVEVIQ